jgi:MFS family permease
VAFLPVAATQGLMAIYAVAFALSGATQFFVPAEAATIPTIVRKTQLITANSLFTTTMMASVIFGFALGDPLINIFGLSQVHWAIVGLFSLASLSLLFVHAPKAEVSQEHLSAKRELESSFQQFIAEMKEGIHYIWENQLILRAMLKLALLFSAVVALCILFIGFAKEFLYDNPLVAARKFAYIIAMSGVGMAVGAFIVGRFFRKTQRSWMVFGGFTVMGVCLLLLAFIETIAKTDRVFSTPLLHVGLLYLEPIQYTFRMMYTYSLVSLMGIGAAFVAIPLQALLHEIIPEDKRGKILGVQFTILSTCSTLPVLAAGLGAEQLGTKWMFVLIGIPFLLLGVYGLYQRLMKANGTAADW